MIKHKILSMRRPDRIKFLNISKLFVSIVENKCGIKIFKCNDTMVMLKSTISMHDIVTLYKNDKELFDFFIHRINNTRKNPTLSFIKNISELSQDVIRTITLFFNAFALCTLIALKIKKVMYKNTDPKVYRNIHSIISSLNHETIMRLNLGNYSEPTRCKNFNSDTIEWIMQLPITEYNNIYYKFYHLKL